MHLNVLNQKETRDYGNYTFINSYKLYRQTYLHVDIFFHCSIIQNPEEQLHDAVKGGRTEEMIGVLDTGVVNIDASDKVRFFIYFEFTVYNHARL